MSFQFLSNNEFAVLDSDAKSVYIVEATKAVEGMADDIKAHVESRHDEIQGQP
jgi:adenosyl cobinamide kinase/adenosyl cobinamide phosphate guanylyltransferase